jgi:hypothetical protein
MASGRAPRRGFVFKPRPKLAVAELEPPTPRASRGPWAAIVILWVVTVVSAVLLHGGHAPFESWLDAAFSSRDKAAERAPAAVPDSEIRPAVQLAPMLPVAPLSPPAPTHAATPLPREEKVRARHEGPALEVPERSIAAGYVTPGRPFGGERPAPRTSPVDEAVTADEAWMIEDDEAASRQVDPR